MFAQNSIRIETNFNKNLFSELMVSSIQKQPFVDILQNKCFYKFAVFTGKQLACDFIKKRLQRRCFPMIIAKFLRTNFSQNISGRLLQQNHEQNF